MIIHKTAEEIEFIRQSAQILGKAHAEVAKLINIGIKTAALDKVAETFIMDNGGVPSFKNYNGFPFTLCISVNENVVHGMPGDYELEQGDIISVDCGVFKFGFHSDSAYTYAVGEISPQTQKLLDVTKQSLFEGIAKVANNARIGDVSFAIQNYAEANGFSVVRELVGHGIGRKLHEEPEVPNFGKRGKGIMLKEGMVIAIEPMINQGKKEVIQEKDGWTIRTRDRQPSAHFEHTVAIQNGKAEILTTFEYIEQVLTQKNGKAILN